MIEKYLVIVCKIFSLTTCAFLASRYSTCMPDTKQLPPDLSTAHEVIVVQSESLKRQDEEIQSLKASVEELQAELRLLKFGKKPEKYIGADQLLLQFTEDKELQAALEAARKEAEEQLETITYTRAKAKKERKPPAEGFPAHLPREEVQVDIPAEYQQRIDDGELFVKNYRFTETLKYVPAKCIVLRYKMPVLAYVDQPERELLVESEGNLGEKERYHPSVAAHVANSKFGLHLPLYRLQDVFASSGLTLSRSQLDYMLDLAYEATQEVHQLMQARLLESNCIGMDDTHTTLIMPPTIPKLDPQNKDPRVERLIEKMIEAKKKKKDSLDAKMWGYTSYDPQVPYDLLDFRVSRHRDGPAEMLVDYAGNVMADCYSGNLAVILAPQSQMTRMACMTHARRHVYTHQNNDASVSATPLALLNKLFDVERRAVNLSHEARLELRATQSRLYLDRLREFLDGPLAASLLPESKLAGAMQYLRNHWEALNVYISDGRLPIDNNQCERLMRRVAVGRKNWLFVGSLRSGMRNAALMSLVASAQRNDLDVHMYLESVITHATRGTARAEELLPDIWKQHHPQAVRVYREQERQQKADTAVEQAARRRVKNLLKQELQS
jgi:transposase